MVREKNTKKKKKFGLYKVKRNQLQQIRQKARYMV